MRWRSRTGGSTSSSEVAELVVHTEEPLNAEPRPDALVRSFLTPRELFFVRNHGPVPDVDPAEYRLEVAGAVSRPLSLSLDDLRGRFPRHDVQATLCCAGNRRAQLAAVRPVPDELPWGDAAIGTAWWSGVPLREVLWAAGVGAAAAHVELSGLDSVTEDEDADRFAGSIPVGKALERDTLLAYEMNGAPLPPRHGFPLRALVPGYVGARSVKWLARVTAADRPSSSYYYARSYRLFPPGASADDVRWEEGLPLGELAVNSAICTPGDGETVAAGRVTVEGWAMVGSTRAVERVDISADGGATWTSAELMSGASPWTWTLWSAVVELPPGRHELVARAVDTAANTQPERSESIWNFKGYANNAWPRVSVVAA